MNYIVKIEGQEIPLPEEIAKSDEGVKRALAPYYPEAANALITRVENEGVTSITVVKRAGTKGAIGVLHLVECVGGQNPAIALALEIGAMQNLDALGLLELDARIEAAIQDGEAQAEQVKGARERLEKTAPSPAPGLIVGF